MSKVIELFQRAKSIGYCDSGAARVADVFDVFYPAPFGDECETHPAMRRFSDGKCESCEVVRLSDEAGFKA